MEMNKTVSSQDSASLVNFFSAICVYDNIDPPDVLPGSDNIRSSEMTLEKSVERLWHLEKHGFESDDCKTMSVEDKRALNMLHT